MQRALARGAAALGSGRTARQLDRAASALVPDARRRRRDVPRAGARLRSGVQPVARRVRRRGRVRRGADAARAPRAARCRARSPVSCSPPALAAGAVLVSNVFHSSGDGRRPAVRQPARHRQSRHRTARSCSTWPVSRWCSSRDAGCSRRPSRRRPPHRSATGAAVYDAVLLLLLGATVVSCSAAIGGFVVSGLLVVPAATARLLARSVRQVQVGGALLAAVEATLGLVLAFHLDVPPGAAIAVLAASVYLGRRDRRAVAPPPRATRARSPASSHARAARAGAAASVDRARQAQPPRARRARSRSSRPRRSCRISFATSAARASSVTGILKPNVDPHEYEPRPSDAVALTTARS